MTTSQNKNLWTKGIRMKMSLFDGFKKGAIIDENKAVLNRITIQQEMLKRDLALSLQYLY